MAIDTEQLAVIKSGISSAMTESAGQFRQAANASAANMTKIVKDISSIFAAQRRDLANLSNSMDEVVHELEINNSKFDNLERVFEESLSIQTAMRSDIKTVALTMKSLNDGIYQLDRNIQSSMIGPNGLLAGLTAGLTSGFGGVTGKLGELLLKVGVPLAAGAAAGGAIGYTMGGGGGGGGDTSVHKTSSEKQAIGKELGQNLMRDFGLTNYQAAGVLGHFGHESGFDPGVNEKKPLVAKSRGGYGLAQWTGPRRKQLEAFAASHNMPVNSEKTQYEFLKQEPAFKTYIEKVKQTRSMEEATQAFLPFETGGDPRAIVAMGDRLKWGRTAMGWLSEKNQQATSDNSSQSSTMQQSSSNATPITQTPVTPAAMLTVPTGSTSTPADTHNDKGETVGKDAEKVKGQGATGSLPSGDIVALGRALEQRNIRVSEHPLFGGVHRVHGPNSAHYKGQAIDINATSGNPKEADDPVMGPKFDKLAQELQAAGYTVLWKVRKHFNHIHAQIGGQGIRGGKSAIGGGSTTDYSDTKKEQTTTPSTTAAAAAATTPMATAVAATPVVSTTTPTDTTAAPTTPPSVTETPAAPPAPEPAATPVSQEPVTPTVSAPMSTADTKAMMGMVPGGIEDIFEQIGAFFESLFSPPELMSQQQSMQNQNAELLQSLSSSMKATQMISQSAIQSQARQTAEDIPQSSPTSMSPSISTSQNKMAFEQAGYAYNYPWDVSWPDWASMIGGNHWSEMRKIKKNMWA